MNLIGNNIKIIRKQIGLTQEELALHIGVTPQAVSRWENGTGMPDISMVVPLAKTLNVSTDYLFGLEKNEIDDNVYVELKRHIEKIETESGRKAEAAHFILQKNPSSRILYVTSEEFTNEVIEAIRNSNNTEPFGRCGDSLYGLQI